MARETSWVKQHPWMTFFLVGGTIGSIGTVLMVMSRKPAGVLPTSAPAQSLVVTPGTMNAGRVSSLTLVLPQGASWQWISIGSVPLILKDDISPVTLQSGQIGGSGTVAVTWIDSQNQMQTTAVNYQT